MSPIVLIGVPDDKTKLRKAADGLHALGLDFWCPDASLTSRKTVKAVAEARCVLLFFTNASTNNKSFITLAAKCFRAKKAIGVLLEKVILPTNLTGLLVRDMRHYNGKRNDPFLKDLYNAASAKSKGIEPPAPQGPIFRLIWRAITIAAPIFIVFSVIIGLLSDAFGSLSGLKDLTSQYDTKQRTAYDKSRTCEDLREFARKYGDGHYVSEARMRFSNPKITTVPEVVDADQLLDEYVLRDTQKPQASEVLARQRAADAMRIRVQEDCERASLQLNAKLQSAHYQIKPSGWSCPILAAGHACGLSATAICKMSVPRQVQHEECSEAKQ